MADETTVRDALSRIVDPARGTDILSANMVKGLSVKDGAVSFVLEVDPARVRPLDMPLLLADPSRLAGLGWTPTSTLEEALDELWTSVRSGGR